MHRLKQFFGFFLFLFLFAGCDVESIMEESSSDSGDNSSVVYASENCSSGTTNERLDCLLQQYYSESGAVGALLYAIDSSQSEYVSSKGSLQENDNTPITIDSEFRIGEITQLFSAFSVIELTRNFASFTLENYAASHLPSGLKTNTDIPNVESMLIYQLLQHRSGLADYEKSRLEEFVANPSIAWSLDSLKDSSYTAGQDYDYVSKGSEIILDQSGLFFPNNGYFSSHLNHHLLGAIVENITGGSAYPEIINKLVSDMDISMKAYVDLNLTNTYYPETSSFSDSYVRGYYDNGSESLDVSNQDPSFYGASGAMISSARDLMNVLRFMNDSLFLNTKWYDINMQQFEDTDWTDIRYGYGLEEVDSRFIGHRSVIPGYAAFAYRDNVSGTYFIIFCNTTDQDENTLDGIGLIRDAVQLFE